MKTLVTGGSGFIGSFLVSELKKEGHHVTILTNDQDFTSKDTDVVYADITDRDRMLDVIPQFDCVYHLAGLLGTSELIDQAHKASMVNIIGTLNILDGALKKKTKVVHITKPNVWLNTYSITKKAGEDFAKMYHQEFGLPTISIKWFNVYGPNQSFHCQKAVPFFIKWALANEPIQVWGSGEQTADLIYAKDAVRATILLAKHPILEGDTYDVGSGQETRVCKLAQMIKDMCESKSDIIYNPMRAGETEDTRLCADTHFLNELGFEFQWDLKRGLEETIRWYKDQSQHA